MSSLVNIANGSTVFLIALVVYLVVWAIKQSKLDNQYLPIVAEIIGGVIGLAISLLQGDVSAVLGVIDGLAAGAISVGGNELIKSVAAVFPTKEAK
ncbi:phage holin family protein [Lactiplantibacillus pingfangensis]|uniref:phage holin family protein n=1 Tax=Lactiplantibacillus TaxID=2767842 RepID=UPI0010FA01F7|nr:phage holin family protein [Lactiplantibacillus pingfangensis]